METRIRSLLKAVIYRVVVTIILALVSWYFTHNLTATSAITIIYNVIVIGFYYLYERVWGKIKWGRKSE
jgi:uncharacterized membrane protein